MMNRFRLLIILSLFLVLLFPVSQANAQDQQENPVYVVQPGDTLGSIASRFGITMDDLIQANTIADPNAISVGDQIIIPGLEGVSGVLVTETVLLGETLHSLSFRYNIPEETLIKLNHITSPTEIYAGSSLILPQQGDVPETRVLGSLAPEQSLLELAVKNELNPWDLVETNKLGSTWNAHSGEVLYTKAGSETEQDSAVPFISPSLKNIEINPLPLVQGTTAVIFVTTDQPLDITGSLDSYPLRFFPDGENRYVALQGVHAMSEPGLIPLQLEGADAGTKTFQFEQNLLLYAANFPSEELVVDPITIDPNNTEPEEVQVREIIKEVTPTRYWDSAFLMPVSKPICIRSWYGGRRSYNNGAYNNFHSGLDFGVCGEVDPLAIYTPAPGVVVFTGPLIVRGNTTFVDHGWGIYSGFFHQEEIQVQVGDTVQAGQVIGTIGATGRVTGAHLHYDLWVNGVQVDPLDWLEIDIYPTAAPQE